MKSITRKISKYNFSNNNSPKYIVIHDTGNKTDSASGNANYFNGGNRGASAHYFVDDNSIYQVVEEYNASWHCGDGAGKYGITNYNSIGIEMCRSNNTVTATTEVNTIELVKYLMNKYSITADKVVRHYDASRKCCPSSFSGNNWARWTDFKNKLNATPTKFTHIATAQANIVQSDESYISTIYVGQKCEFRWWDNGRMYVKLQNGSEGLVEKSKTDNIVKIEDAYTHYNIAGYTINVSDNPQFKGEVSGAVWENEKICVVWINEYGNAYIAYDNSNGDKLSKLGYVPSNCLCKIGEEIKEEPKPVEPPKEEKPTVLYRVQVGAYSKKENAENLVKDLKEKGFDAYIKE